jgi:hypothetical protein
MQSLSLAKLNALKVAVVASLLTCAVVAFVVFRSKTALTAFTADESRPVFRENERAVSPSAEPARRPTLSRLPLDVLRDFSYNGVHLLNGAGAPLYGADDRYQIFLTRLRQYPPDVLIVGKEAPLTHSLGPILSFGGENRTFPPVANRKGEDPRRQLSPDELRLRVKAAEQFVKDVHSAGVKTVVPYISPMTMFGNAQRRQGFFEFFDSWDKYAKEFDLGARPAGDPLDWTQRDKQGQNYFRVGGGAEDVAGFTRYSMCINNPGWRRWQILMTDWIARVGYDGVWMDNVLVHRCYDEYCQAVAKSMGTDLSRDADRVWLESYLRYFDDLRAAGSQRRSSFFLGGNYIEVPFQRAVSDKLDLSMIEQVWLGAARILWPGGVWTGYYPPMPTARVLNNRSAGTNDARSFNNLWLARLSYAMRGDRGVHFLAGAPANKGPEFAHNEDSAVLALAEAAVFGGGAAVQVTGQYPLHSDSDVPANKARQRFFQFVRAHHELYENLLPAGNIAIVVFPDQEVAGMVEAQQVQEALLWRGFLVDVLDGDKQNAATLGRYSLVIVPGQPDLPAWMKAVPMLQSPDPLTPKEVTELKKSYQRDRNASVIRHTKLSELAVAKAESLRSLTLPNGSLVQGCAWANDQRIVVHLLNFRVPIGTANAGKVEPVREISVRLTIPKGKTVREVKTLSTDAPDAKTLPFQQRGDALSFAIPSVRVYQAVAISY